MGFGFRKSFKVAPGIKFNIGKKSAGVSIGGKYGGISFNTKSGARARASAPGTGISYTTQLSQNRRNVTRKRSIPTIATPERVKRPVTLRVWYLVLAIILMLSGAAYLEVNIFVGILVIAIGCAMLWLRRKARKEESKGEG